MVGRLYTFLLAFGLFSGAFWLVLGSVVSGRVIFLWWKSPVSWLWNLLLPGWRRPKMSNGKVWWGSWGCNWCLFFLKDIIYLLERVVISNDLLILVCEPWLFVELMILYFYCSFIICQAHWRFTYPWSKLGYLFNIQLHFSFRWDSCFGTQILNPSVSETGKWTKVFSTPMALEGW